MRWIHEETGHPIDENTGRLILPVDLRDQIEVAMIVPYFEITYDHPDGTRRVYYESCDEAPIHLLYNQKRDQLEIDGCEIITSMVRTE